MLMAAAVVWGLLALVDDERAAEATQVAVRTLDAQGRPVANVPIEWGRWMRRIGPPPEDVRIDAPWIGSSLTDATGTASWDASPSRSRDEADLHFTVFARLPLRTPAFRHRSDQEKPLRIDVGSVAFAEVEVRTPDGRAVRSDDLVLAFDDDSSREELVRATMFARDGDHFVVPIARDGADGLHVRAGLADQRSARVALTAGDCAILELAPSPRIRATLTSPARELVRETKIELAPVDPGAKRTCLFHDGVSTQRQPNDARTTSVTTDAEGVVSFAVPFDLRSADARTEGRRQTDRLAVRLEVHHPFGACWIGLVPWDGATESGTIDVGTIRLLRDEWMVCGRVIDDRGEPVADAAMKSSETDDVTIGIGSERGSPYRTDAHGRFRIRLREPRPFVAVRDGYLSPPSIVLDPGTTDHEFVLQRCASIALHCVPSETLIPERFALRWSHDSANGLERLHAWDARLERLVPGRLAVELTLDGIDTGMIPRELVLEPGSTAELALDLRGCGLVTLRVVDSERRPLASARVRFADAQREVASSANGVVRFAIRTATASLTCEADGFAPVTGVYAHGEHVVVLQRRD